MRVHLDHNATTPLRPEVRALLAELLDEPLGNPSSLHARGRRARQLIDEARERTAAALGVHEDEVLFTGGGTEAIHLGLVGALRALGPAAGFVTSPIEHSAVLGAAGQLGSAGHPWCCTAVDEHGRLDPEAVGELLEAPWARLLAIQAANNEVGVVPDFGALLEQARARPGEPALVFTDAVRALGRIELPLARPGADAAAGADLLALSAHKVGGPTGVGVLVRRRGVALVPLVAGREHESGLRPGTENTAGIAAAALAIELAVRERGSYAARTRALSTDLWNELARRLPGARLLGPPMTPAQGEPARERLPNTLCVALPDVDGKVLVTRLDLEGLEVSAGSACASGSLEPSHVLHAMGCDERVARAGIRLSLGRTTTRDECARAVDILEKVFGLTRAT
jgi:cysteine desulfurase